MNLWDKYNLKNNKYYFFKIGYLNLWIHKKDEEWFIGYKYDTEHHYNFLKDVKKPENIEWNQYLVSNTESNIEIKPSLPDKPLLINSKYDLYILPKSENIYFTDIPAFITINLVSTNESIELLSIPTKILSKTWVGNPSSENGVVSYSLTSKLYKTYEESRNNPVSIVVPLKIQNNSLTPFNFTALNIENRFLSIFQKENTFLTETISFNIKKNNQVNIRLNKDIYKDKNATLIKAPIDKMERNLLEKSFKILKNIK
ncbi:MAG: hypothetical protein FXF47_03690 [Candidatus Mcinerneyibacterium aminivorans]|uniref:DUF432 domain-containing protein n=1 Tax=Candidatus Mcinerneyibacterium aminivorans TaxID=2703815 RepID=A0A5D0MJQ0_9BACT|nr:MAG: hypothetical protein FXF47_03690 [Candidatus Mcinerneyibacterium aminivorans]